jgi:pimeloyl-ACP methyl ester carboxylesterase
MPTPYALVAAVFVLTIALLTAFIHLGARAMIRRRESDPPLTPGAYGIHYEEIDFHSPDGLSLRGWFVPAAAAQPQGTVVFCHGQSGSMDRDTPWLPPVHEAGFNVLMFDFRGHGRSDGSSVSLGYFERQDLLGALDYLARRGITRVGLIGFSMGGAVAMAVAADSPAVAAVVSDSGYASLQRVLMGALLERRLPRPLARLAAWALLRYAGWRLKANLAAYEPKRRVGAEFRCPLLAIQGEADPYVPVGDIGALVRGAGGPAELWRVPGSGHRQARELHPGEYRRRVLDFFRHWLGGRQTRPRAQLGSQMEIG